MTTSIRITLPIEPGATTCEGCPLVGRLPYQVCGIYNKRGAIMPRMKFPDRIPECLAAEREKVSEWWEARDEDGDCFCAGAEHSVNKFIAGDKSFRKVHVTRYRRRA